MLRSLRRFDPESMVHVLALDGACARVLRRIFGATIDVTGIGALPMGNLRLHSLRESRRLWEFYATLKPVFLRSVLQEARGAVTFVDGDIQFFSDPSPMFAEIGEASVGLSPHRYSPSCSHLAIHGVYNAGWIYLRCDETARRALEDWETACLEWCGVEPQRDGRFMNQGYLNRWPEKYSAVHVIEHRGVNVGPWNIEGRSVDGLRIDSEPLISYHFSGLLRDPNGNWRSIYPLGRQFELLRDSVYRGYLGAIEVERRRLEKDFGIHDLDPVRVWKYDPSHVLVYENRHDS